MKTPNKPLLDDHLTVDAVPETRYAQQWLVVIFASTALLGMLSAYCRPYFHINGVHWEAIVCMVVLVTLNIVCLILISTDKRKHYVRFYSTLTFLLWIGYMAGWSIVDGDIMEDLLAVGISTATVAILVGMAVFAYQKRKEK